MNNRNYNDYDYPVSNRNYSRGNNNYNNGGQGSRKKKSGAGHGINADTRNFYVHGWNVSRSRGFISMIATVLNASGKKQKNYSPGDVITSKSGKQYHKAVCNVTFRSTGEVKTLTGFYEIATKKLYIPDLGMVANPKAPNGGYFGTSKRPSNNNRRY